MKTLLLFMIISVTGCATITRQASNVMLYNQMNSLLNDCKKLGFLSAGSSEWEKWDMSQATIQAKNNLRDQAASRYGADSVLVINTDTYVTSVKVEGIAFKCNN